MRGCMAQQSKPKVESPKPALAITLKYLSNAAEAGLMFRRQAIVFASLTLAFVAAVALSAQQTQNRGQQQPPRDTSAQRTTSDAVPTAKGRIAGRVLTADTGRPVSRARVFINAAAVPGGRGTLTDAEGAYAFTELPAGRYTVQVSKTGFISLSYGKRRPLMAGTPLQLNEAQQLSGIDFRLPRGSVIAGHVLDESGDPMPGISVQVMRYEYAQGGRQLVPAGTAQTDDQGAFRVWGLNPGSYYVSAMSRNVNFNFGGRGGPGRGGPAPSGSPPANAAGGPGRGGPSGGGGRGGAVTANGGRGIPSADALGAAAGADTEPVAYAPTFYPGVASVDGARAVTVGLSAEVLDVNFGLLLVHVARVSGHVINSDGEPSSTGNVNLLPESFGGRSLGRPFSARVQWDGSFSMTNIPPGRYVIRARGDDTAPPQFGMQSLVVADGDVNDVTVNLAP